MEVEEAASSMPQATLHALPHADGSASFTFNGIEILATVNGPLEAQRRDELPDEAFLEVNVRPASGSGSPRDRQLERVVARTLRAMIILSALPRALVQVTLQIVSMPADTASGRPSSQSDSILPVLAPLVNAAVLALLAANIPMRGVCTATEIVDERQDGDGQTRHVFAFDADGKCLLAESQGNFSLEQWRAASDAASQQSLKLHAWLRDAVGRDLRERNRWRENL